MDLLLLPLEMSLFALTGATQLLESVSPGYGLEFRERELDTQL